MAEDRPRAKRATKKPAWLLDNVDPSSAEAEGDAKLQRHQQKRSTHNETGHRAVAKQEHAERQQRPEAPRRMCLNPGCKNPFDSPQWRRGPLGPGTLCNACGTRYARIEAKKRGEKKGGSKLRPQDVAEWQAFEQQLRWPPDMRQAWAEHAADSARMVRQAQQQQQQQQQQHYEDEYECEDDQAQLGLQEHDELLCQESVPNDDSPGKAETANAAAAAVAAAVEQAARQAARQACANAATGSSSWLLNSRIRQQQQASSQQNQAGNEICRDSYLFEANIAARIAALRQRRRFDNEDGSDSQEAAACSYQEPANCTSSGNSRRPDAKGGSGTPGDQFLHLLAVGEAMIKTEGVAPQDRREAWAEYVEKQLPSEQQKPSCSRPADSNVRMKRTHLDAAAAELQGAGNEQQSKLPAPSKDHFEQLVAEAECAVRARSASPLLRPVTPQDCTAAAAPAVQPATVGDAVPNPAAAAGTGSAAVSAGCLADRSPVPGLRLGDAALQSQQHQPHQPGILPPLVLPAAATTAASGSASTAAGAGASAGGPLVAASASGPVNSPSKRVQPAHGDAGDGHASTNGRSTTSTNNGTASTAGMEHQAMRGSPDRKLLLADELLSPTISMPEQAPALQQQQCLEDTSHAPTSQQQQDLPKCKQLPQQLPRWQQQELSHPARQSQLRSQLHQPRLDQLLPTQPTQKLQQQDLVLHMLGGLVTAALGLQAEPTQGASKNLSAERARLQKLLADPVTVRLLSACLADPAAAAWLKDFLGKVGVEGEVLQQKLLGLASHGQLSQQPGAKVESLQLLQHGTRQPAQQQDQQLQQPDVPQSEAAAEAGSATQEQPREHLLEGKCPTVELQQPHRPSKAADCDSNTGVYHNKRLRTMERIASQHAAAANTSA